MVYVIQVSWQLASRIGTELQFRPDPARNCPKHVELYSKNKFEKLVHLVGFIIRIYHDARSPERQIKQRHFLWTTIGRFIQLEGSWWCPSGAETLKRKKHVQQAVNIDSKTHCVGLV